MKARFILMIGQLISDNIYSNFIMKKSSKINYFFLFLIIGFSTVYGAKYPTTGSVERLDSSIDDLISNCKNRNSCTGIYLVRRTRLDKDGEFLLYSDVPANKVYKWKEGKDSVYLDPSGYCTER